MDRESLTLPVSNSLFYTSPITTASEVGSISSCSDRDSAISQGNVAGGYTPAACSTPTGSLSGASSLAVVELTEEVRLFFFVYSGTGYFYCCDTKNFVHRTTNRPPSPIL